MRFARFRIGQGGPVRIGVVDTDAGEIVEVPGAEEAGLVALCEVLRRDPSTTLQPGPHHSLDSVELLAPIARPPKFLAIGLNYAAHVEETGRQRPEHPTFFNKQSTCVTGPNSPIHLPRASQQVDYEGELGVVIGTPCRHVPAERAREVIAGYVVVNDVSARDWQYRSPTWTLGKSFDTHGPIGPWLVAAPYIDDPQALHIRTWVNGELRQDAPTSDMLFSCYEQVETLSTVCTLEPGDVIATGTPSGVGMALDPPRFLAAGDVVRITIDGIGTLENPVIPEPEDTVLLP